MADWPFIFGVFCDDNTFSQFCENTPLINDLTRCFQSLCTKPIFSALTQYASDTSHMASDLPWPGFPLRTSTSRFPFDKSATFSHTPTNFFFNKCVDTTVLVPHGGVFQDEVRSFKKLLSNFVVSPADKNVGCLLISCPCAG